MSWDKANILEKSLGNVFGNSNITPGEEGKGQRKVFVHSEHESFCAFTSCIIWLEIKFRVYVPSLVLLHVGTVATLGSHCF